MSVIFDTVFIATMCVCMTVKVVKFKTKTTSFQEEAEITTPASKQWLIYFFQNVILKKKKEKY